MSGLTKDNTGMNHALACTIFAALNAKGAGLGNVSVHIIESVLDAQGVRDLPTLADFTAQAQGNLNQLTTQHLTGKKIYLKGFADAFEWLDKL